MKRRTRIPNSELFTPGLVDGTEAFPFERTPEEDIDMLRDLGAQVIRATARESDRRKPGTILTLMVWASFFFRGRKDPASQAKRARYLMEGTRDAATPQLWARVVRRSRAIGVPMPPALQVHPSAAALRAVTA